MIYFDQNPVSLTQQREVFKQDREKLDTFFQNIWNEQDTVFPLHLDFLLDHNFIENLGDGLQLSYALSREWFEHDIEVQNTLLCIIVTTSRRSRLVIVCFTSSRRLGF